MFYLWSELLFFSQLNIKILLNKDLMMVLDLLHILYRERLILI